MASTRTIVRGARHRWPIRLKSCAANAELVPEIPASMFVTAFCGILDPLTGRLQYANAGTRCPTGARASR